MKTLTTLLALALFCATGYGQTIKALGYNTTNGEVVANTGTNVLTFTNAPAFTDAATVRTNLGLGATAQTIFTVKTNDQTIIDETNATTITDLTFATEPGARYVVTFLPIAEAEAGGTVFQVIASNATVYGTWNFHATGFGSTNVLTNEASSSVTGARGFLQTFYVEGATNAGAISVTFKSGPATNTNTIKEGSFLRADKMP
jgi:hypothetical protein